MWKSQKNFKVYILLQKVKAGSREKWKKQGTMFIKYTLDQMWVFSNAYKNVWYIVKKINYY